MEQTNLDCKQIINNICENLGEDDNSPNCIAMKKHLENCPNCQSYLKNVTVTIDLYKNYNAEITDEIHNKLLNFLELSDCK